MARIRILAVNGLIGLDIYDGRSEPNHLGYFMVAYPEADRRIVLICDRLEKYLTSVMFISVYFSTIVLCK